MSSIFEDAAPESIVFVVPERWSARDVLDLSNGMAKMSPTIVFVVSWNPECFNVLVF